MSSNWKPSTSSAPAITHRHFFTAKPTGALIELPVSWYTERQGFWAMSPGYDRPAHPDFRRLINTECMACHNGYPRGSVEDAGNGPRFPLPLPRRDRLPAVPWPGAGAHRGDQDRQYRRGPPGHRQSRELRPRPEARDLHAVPSRVHEQSAAVPDPAHTNMPPFSYTPGKALADYFLYFDHAPGTGRDDKFEIASGAYRLRKSACFRRAR